MDKKDMKKELVNAWKEVFNVSSANDDSDFFEDGGDSLKAVQLSTWLVQKGIKLELETVFTNPTLGEMAETLTETTPIYVPEALLTKQIAADEMYDKIMDGTITIPKDQALMYVKSVTPEMYNQMKENTDSNKMNAMLEKMGLTKEDLKGTVFDEGNSAGSSSNQQKVNNSQQVCTPNNFQQVCTPDNNQQVCTPNNSQQICTPPQNGGVQPVFIPVFWFPQQAYVSYVMPQQQVCTPPPQVCTPQQQVCTPPPQVCTPQQQVCTPPPQVCTPDNKQQICTPDNKQQICTPQGKNKKQKNINKKQNRKKK